MTVRLKGDFDASLEQARTNIDQLYNGLLMDGATWSEKQRRHLLTVADAIQGTAKALTYLSKQVRDD
jgi:hypothetical protein